MRIVVQKFGGSSLSSAAMRREAMLRVREAVQEGLMPVVVVSAMGRLGDAYATDTLLKLMQETNPAAEGANLDLLLSCGEIISAAIFAEGLSQMGLAAQALTGWQWDNHDDVHQGARVKRVQVGRLLECVDAGIIPIVAGFQGVSRKVL